MVNIYLMENVFHVQEEVIVIIIKNILVLPEKEVFQILEVIQIVQHVQLDIIQQVVDAKNVLMGKHPILIEQDVLKNNKRPLDFSKGFYILNKLDAI